GTIRRAADKNIPKKKVSNSSSNRTRKCKPTKLHKSTVKLGKIIQMVKRSVTDGDQSIDIEKLSKEIEQINNMHQADIPGLSCKIDEKETLYKW
ncbi:4745_t:CDS:1, partial [Dentiscutata heterogama]